MKDPKEKAAELMERFFDIKDVSIGHTALKSCALICVDEIYTSCVQEQDNYWQQVKTEIEKL